jgi:GT2 family glycosyltransferase/glycosyltransferase involved in cell wall biosynthesis
MTERQSLSAFVISYNRRHIVETTLRALAFADELILVDKSSTDDTVKIAEPLVDRIVIVPWTPTVEETRSYAASLCSHDWILFLDDDECLTPEAVRFIDAELHAPRADIYALSQRHHVLGIHDERAYYWPEAQIRLYRKGALEFAPTVHQGLRLLSDDLYEVPASTGAAIMHLSHANAAQWIEKANRYTSQADRLRSLDETVDMVGFAHKAIDKWTAGARGHDYPVAVGLLRSLYDLIDRIKSWEEEQGLDGEANFAAVCRQLESRYADELADLVRRPAGRPAVAAERHAQAGAAEAGPSTAQLARTNAILTDLLGASRDAAANLQRDLEDVRQDLRQEGFAKNRIAADLTDERLNAANRASKLYKIAAYREKRIAELERRISNKDKDIEAARRQVSDLLRRNGEKNREISEISGLLTQARERISQLDAQERGRRKSVFYKPFREVMRIERQIRELPRRLDRPLNPDPVISAPPQVAEVGQPEPDYKASMRAALALRLEGFMASGAELRLPSAAAPDVSILLILHNQAELTFGCLTSITESLGASDVVAEVIILDNLSTDSTGELLRRISGAKIIRSPENLHFLRGVNLAAREATGRHLLLLNNDAQLYPQSIEAALRILDREADVGAVGGRIITPDGLLQEAGSIIWKDGSCAGYARGCHPLDPVAMFRRDVDYCSGAFLMTPRRLFEEMGGFDEAYAPAYYEETDYCARLWEAGFRIIYEPDAVILHYEFGSSTQAEGAIALQRRNQLTFQARHQDWLGGQLANSPENVLVARRRRTSAKRILMIEDRVPQEKLGSGYPRAGAILRELATRAELTLFPTAGEKEDWLTVRHAVPANVEVMIDDSRASLGAFLKARRGQFDAILVCRPHNMQAFLESGGADPDIHCGAAIVYDAEAVFATREVHRLACQGKPMTPADARRLLEAEIALAHQACQVIAVSPADQRLFQSNGIPCVRVLGHAFEIDITHTSFEDRPDILFVGAVHEESSPNADSLRWFASEILPRLRQKLRPDLRLKVVGLNRAASIELLDGDALELVGPVEDLRPHFETARLLVAPTRYAAGIPHKLGQAAAFGVPIVATHLLAEQINWISERDLLAATDPQAFADACVRLYSDPLLWDRLRRSAIDRCREAWSPEAFESTIMQILEDLDTKAKAPIGASSAPR